MIACRLVQDAGAAFVKTSTGFNPGGGATVADVRLMRATVGPQFGVKAAGGIRTLADAMAMIRGRGKPAGHLGQRGDPERAGGSRAEIRELSREPGDRTEGCGLCTDLLIHDLACHETCPVLPAREGEAGWSGPGRPGFGYHGARGGCALHARSGGAGEDRRGIRNPGHVAGQANSPKAAGLSGAAAGALAPRATSRDTDRFPGSVGGGESRNAGAFTRDRRSKPRDPPCRSRLSFGRSATRILFQGTAARSAGPCEPIVVRHDSCLTLPEPGLAAVLGPDGGVAAFSICDDVTARDLALAQPAFLSQAKVYGGSFALGPCLVTPDELGDPHPLQVRCTILRGGEPMFSEAVGTAGLPRRLTELAVWLGRDNPGVPGAVVFVGAGVEIPEALALRNGDRVDIEAQGIGRLSNPVGR